jgi:hypothetical protein
VTLLVVHPPLSKSSGRPGMMVLRARLALAY